MEIKITNNNLNNYNDTLYILKYLKNYQYSIVYYGKKENEFIKEYEKEFKNKKIKYVKKHVNYLNSIDIEDNDVLIIEHAEAKSDKSLMYIVNYLYGKKKQVIMNYYGKVNWNLRTVLKNKKYIISELREEL